MSTLAEAMSFSRSRITHTITRMERSGLVDRCAASDDGRGIVAQLTEQGYATLVEAAPIHVTGVRAHMVDLADDDDFTALGRVMDAVVDQLAPGAPRGRPPHRRRLTRRSEPGAAKRLPGTVGGWL